MSNFRASFCDPLKPQIIDLGEIEIESVISRFENIIWDDYLQKMESATEEEIFYSPSFEIKNKTNNHSLAISAVGAPDSYEFFIFYKRPKLVKAFFGLKEKMKEGYMSEKTGQTRQDVHDCLDALLRNDTTYLADKIGE